MQIPPSGIPEDVTEKLLLLVSKLAISLDNFQDETRKNFSLVRGDLKQVSEDVTALQQQRLPRRRPESHHFNSDSMKAATSMVTTDEPLPKDISPEKDKDDSRRKKSIREISPRREKKEKRDSDSGNEDEMKNENKEEIGESRKKLKKTETEDLPVALKCSNEDEEAIKKKGSKKDLKKDKIEPNAIPLPDNVDNLLTPEKKKKERKIDERKEKNRKERELKEDHKEANVEKKNDETETPKRKEKNQKRDENEYPESPPPEKEENGEREREIKHSGKRDKGQKLIKKDEINETKEEENHAVDVERKKDEGYLFLVIFFLTL